MISIAILDDSETDLNQIELLVCTYFNRRKVTYNIKKYVKFEILMMDIHENKYFDLFFLDMAIPGSTGIQVAKQIRQKYQDPIIVYITNYLEYAVDGYEVNAIRYIPKSMLKERLNPTLDLILCKIEQLDQRAYIIKYDGTIEKILYRNIFYIRKEGKYSVFYYRNGQSKIRKTLQELYKELDPKNFIYIDKSCIVNIIHILSCGQGEVKMRDQMCLPISRARYQEVRKQIIQLWREESQ